MDLKQQINSVIPNDLKVKLKEMLVKFEESIAPETPAIAEPAEAPEVKEVKTKDGLIFQVEGMEVGKAVNQVTDAGVVPAMDGTYELETGETISVAAGLISEIKPIAAAPEVVAPEMGEVKTDVETLKATVASLSELVSKMSSQLKEQNNTIGLTLSAINSIVELPAGKPIEQPKSGLFSSKNKQLENLSKIKNK